MTKVLIVDDQKENRYMLDVVLAGRGYEVVTAENGAEALKKAKELRPDLIVTDILMPVMDGFALCRQCKSDPGLKDIPLIFYTATYTTPEDEKFALGLGADKFIVKPQEPDFLVRAVEDVLEESSRSHLTARKPLGEEMEFFRQYNETLFRKLENKLRELEREANDRRQAEAALRDSEEKYRTLFAHSPDGILIGDLEGKFLSVNQAICTDMGYTEAEMLSMSIWDIVPERHWETHKARLASILKGELLDFTDEYEVKTKSGLMLPVEVRSAPYRHGEKIAGFQAIARDITERKRAEAERERLTAALEQARSMQTLGMIASGVAHEVRNPLFAIMTIVAALEKKLHGQSEFAEYLSHIQEQTQSLNLLMSDLLKLGRPIEPKDFEECAFRKVVDKAIALLGDTFPGLDSRCVKHFPDELVPIRGAPERLAQVIVNLLQNAFIFSPPGASVEVSLHRKGGMAVLEVRDLGPGIQPDMMDKLFEPFASKRKGGTGLGLAIVRQIVGVHGGSVEASNNKPPPGATFTLRLPISVRQE